MKEYEVPPGCTPCTLITIEEVTPEGRYKRYGLRDVILANGWLAQALTKQRECEENGEPFVIRLFDDSHESNPPIYAISIISVPVIDADIPTRAIRFNWNN